MKYARVFAPFALAAALAACSGNLGSGTSSLPGGPSSAPVSQIAQPVATSTPLAASNVATLSDSVAPQPLPTVLGWGGTVTFPKPAVTSTASPNPKSTASPGGPVSIGLTGAVVEPTDAPKFNQIAEARRHRLLGKKEDPTAIKGLFFITLLATADVTLNEYPRFAIDVPRDVATKYRDAQFALALYDPALKEKRYRLAVAERDLSESAATVVVPTSAPTVAPTLTPTPRPSGTPLAGAFPTPPLAPPGATLPPQRIAFMGTATTLTLKANRPVVFAVYIIPLAPSPEPSPSATGKTVASPNPKASGALPLASPTATGSPVPSASSVPSAAPTAAPTHTPGTVAT